MKYNITFSLSVIFMLSISISCKSAKDAQVSKDSLSQLQQEIEAHGDIRTYNQNSRRVVRSGIDSLNFTETGKINDYINSLEESFPAKTDYIIIKYYPGKDDCNSTGMATRQSLGYGNIAFNKEIDKRSKVSQLNLYKDNDGIERWNKHREFVEDKDLVITNQFFKYHYPCSSYLIWHVSGKYYYYYGESWLEKQLLDVDLFVDVVGTGQI